MQRDLDASPRCADDGCTQYEWASGIDECTLGTEGAGRGMRVVEEQVGKKVGKYVGKGIAEVSLEFVNNR